MERVKGIEPSSRDGRQLKKSTKTVDRNQALEIAI